MGSLGTMLGVWAHPDDEAYLSAGLMARAVREGHRVVCVTATRGEEGTFDEARWPTATMGVVRQGELERSLEVLGVKEHVWLDYYDGTCADQDEEDAVGKVRAIMDRVQPDTVLTFGPDGMTDHADHKAVSAWTTRAFREVAPPGAKLYYATMSPEWAAEWVPKLEPFNVFMSPGTPPVTARAEMGIELEMDDALLEQKMDAIEHHASQVEGMIGVFGREGFRASQRGEYFRLAQER